MRFSAAALALWVPSAVLAQYTCSSYTTVTTGEPVTSVFRRTSYETTATEVTTVTNAIYQTDEYTSTISSTISAPTATEYVPTNVTVVRTVTSTDRPSQVTSTGTYVVVTTYKPETVTSYIDTTRTTAYTSSVFTAVTSTSTGIKTETTTVAPTTVTSYLANTSTVYATQVVPGTAFTYTTCVAPAPSS